MASEKASSTPIVLLEGNTLVAVQGPSTRLGKPCVVERVHGKFGPLGVPRYRVLRSIDKASEPGLDPFKVSGRPQGKGYVVDE